MWEADRSVSKRLAASSNSQVLPPKKISLRTTSFVKQMTLETGEIGRQANGAVNLRYGDTVGTLCALSILFVHSKSNNQGSLHVYSGE